MNPFPFGLRSGALLFMALGQFVMAKKAKSASTQCPSHGDDLMGRSDDVFRCVSIVDAERPKQPILSRLSQSIDADNADSLGITSPISIGLSKSPDLSSYFILRFQENFHG